MSHCFRLVAAALFLVVGINVAAFTPAGAGNSAMMLPVDAAPLIVGDNRQSFRIEVADDAEEMQRGLMFRKDMDDDHGMLFVFAETRVAAFWMKNTPMPLDLVFIGEDGKVRAVLPGTPFSEATISAGVPVRFVLEIKAGMAQKAGIVAGERIHHPIIDEIADN